MKDKTFRVTVKMVTEFEYVIEAKTKEEAIAQIKPLSIAEITGEENETEFMWESSNELIVGYTAKQEK